METKEKLRIANTGGSFDEEDSGWIGKPIRKGEITGIGSEANLATYDEARRELC